METHTRRTGFKPLCFLQIKFVWDCSTRLVQKNVVFFVALILFVTPIYGQHWKALGPFKIAAPVNPYFTPTGSGMISDIAVHPTNQNILFAGSNSGGLWKSLDGGAHWLPSDNGLPQLSGVICISFDSGNPDNMYILTVNNSFVGASSGIDEMGYGYTYGLFESNNGGSSWHSIGYNDIFNGSSTPSYGNFIINRFAIDPITQYPNGVMYLATREGWPGYSRVMRSDNSGQTWYQLSFPGTDLFHDISVDPVNSNYVYFSGSQLWRTPDKGINWTDITSNLVIPSGETVRMVITDVQNTQGAIYALVKTCSSCNQQSPSIKYYIQKSYDYGTTWSVVYTWPYEIAFKGGFEVSAKTDQVFYVGSIEILKIYYSSNNTYLQQTLTNPWNSNASNWVHADQRDFESVVNANNNEVLYSANDGGVSQSQLNCYSNLCNQWSYINHNMGMNNLHFYGFGNSANGEKLITGAQDCGIFMYKGSGFSAYNNEKWKNDIFNDGGKSIIAVDNDNEFYAERFGWAGDITRISKSTNEGQNWNDVSTGLDLVNEGNGSRPLLMQETSKNLYTVYRNVYKSTNRASSWSSISSFSRPSDFRPSISALAVAPSDENYIYVGFADGYLVGNNTTPAYIFYRTTNGLSSTIQWDDRTSNVISSAFRGISDIVVNPNNASELWMVCTGFDQSGNHLRVIHSSDAGDTWTAINHTGLPIVPVNCIEFDKRGNGTLYVGTDAGVYSFDLSNSANSWMPFMSGTQGAMPPAHVIDLEINYESGVIRAATFGRGMWESPLPCPTNYASHIMGPNDPVLIQNGGTIHWQYSSYIIPPGYKLTIDNTTIKMPENARITVLPGAKLSLVNGAKITNGGDHCANIWDGIYLEANSNLPQTPDLQTGLYPDHGWLVIDNSTIEHAYMAVSAGYNAPNSNGIQGGGIVNATNSQFLNNRFSIRFYEYGFSNKSRVKDCHFLCTGSLPFFSNNDGSYSFVSLFYVKDIWLSGNIYENSAPGGDDNPFGSKFRTAGIISVNSTYWVTPSYNPSNYINLCTLPAGRRSMFKGLTHGVFVYNLVNEPDRRAHILNCDFENVSMGVGLNWDTKTKVYGNLFTWNSAFDEYPYFSHPNTAVKTDFAEGFSINENEINFNYPGDGSGIHGISVFESNLTNAGDPTSVYKNTYVNNNTTGSAATGIEINGVNNSNLQFLCNEFTGYQTAINSNATGVIAQHGSLAMSAGNKFKSSCPSARIWGPLAAPYLAYYFDQNNPDEDLTTAGCQSWPGSIFGTTNANSCPPASVLTYYCPEEQGGGGDTEALGRQSYGLSENNLLSNAIWAIQHQSNNEIGSAIAKIKDDDELSLAKILKSIYENNQDLFNLPENQKASLLALSKSKARQVSQHARDILLVYGQDPVKETHSPSAHPNSGGKSGIIAASKNPVVFNLFPNPAQNRFTIVHHLPGVKGEMKLSMYDLHGRVVKETIIDNGSGQTVIETKDLDEGIYLCRIELKNVTIYKTRVIISKQ